ncbi:MAG: RNA polymerase sigma factor RpoE [Endozoicomonadaceae bacterium]|nr:RNA polymerase sigma factor RpoE [Endozoicomonadaceae bacterium]
MANNNSNEDYQLVQKVQKGDQRAFDLLVIKYQHRMFSLIKRYIKDDHETSDVAQEAFIKVYRAIHTFRGESKFYTWIYRIAINASKNFLVARGRRVPCLDLNIDIALGFEDLDLQDISAAPDHLLMTDQTNDKIHKVISSLPECLKHALILREFNGLSYVAISKLVGAPIGTIRSRIFRARNTINEQLNSDYFNTYD